MADISIQFHATPDELLAFAKQAVADFGLHVVAMRFFPFEAVEVDRGRLDSLFVDASPFRRLAFSLGVPVLPVEHELDFADKNPDHLRLDVGRRETSGLRESWLTARTDNPEALAAWKKVAKRLRDTTTKGATATNPRTGATGPARGHRFTAGARTLEAGGVPMLTNTGILLKPGMPMVEGGTAGRG